MSLRFAIMRYLNVPLRAARTTLTASCPASAWPPASRPPLSDAAGRGCCTFASRTAVGSSAFGFATIRHEKVRVFFPPLCSSSAMPVPAGRPGTLREGVSLHTVPGLRGGQEPLRTVVRTDRREAVEDHRRLGADVGGAGRGIRADDKGGSPLLPPIQLWSTVGL
jgi:hypothetical protein